MKQIISVNVKLFFLLVIISSFAQTGKSNEPDSAYIFAYTSGKWNNTIGLNYAWSVDQKSWHAIGPEHRFLFCDFGTWGEQKKMFDPFMLLDQSEQWHCIWTLNNEIGQFAHAPTKNFFEWRSQSYPQVMDNGNILSLEASYNSDKEEYLVTWISETEKGKKIIKTTTKDFKTYSPTKEGAEADRLNSRQTVLINDEEYTGTVHKVSWKIIDGLIKNYEWTQYHNQQRAETLREDGETYANLEPFNASLSIQPEGKKEISDLLVGVFFEDINYAADGGIYAELVENRGFEYDVSDKKGRDQNWNSVTSWTFTGDSSGFTIDTIDPIHINQKHFAKLQIAKVGESLINDGFDGIPVKKGDEYVFSVFAKCEAGKKGKLKVRLIDAEGNVYAEAVTPAAGNSWGKVKVRLKATKGVDNALLEVVPQITGSISLDMVSLFPKNTFKGHENGLRADLAQTIADIHPKFVRFPGGCVAHGDGLGNMYRWKNTVGPLESRTPQRNIWNYHQSAGLGYFEYFQYCEDIGAEPLPVLPAGVPCQNSSDGGHGQQGGIPMCDMDDYVQEVLDLIEWANGDKNTKWGKIRAEAGHPEPFNLKYVGIGNEDLITDIFEERFTMIFKAVKEKHPEITVIGTVGPTYMGTDYVEGWKVATQLKVPVVDEHYYQPPGWFINNQDYYDKYDRTKPKVYLGEYAAHGHRRRMNIETALSEALYLTCVERNADMVIMTSFAPLLGREHHTQWNPDLIYFNSTEVKPTVDYYVQQLFGQNCGNIYVPTLLSADKGKDVTKRLSSSLVYDEETGEYIIKLCNLLPVEVNTTINLAAIKVEDQQANMKVLSGEISDEDTKPVESQLSLSKKTEYRMPAYSFSVIRFKAGE